MAKLTDGKKVVEITMTTWTGSGYTPDWSNDFFGNGGAKMDENGTFHVEDVDYCVDQARDWEAKRGDFLGEEDIDGYERCVDVEDVSE